MTSVGDILSDMMRLNFVENAFNDPDNSSDEPVPLFVVLRTRKKNNKQNGKKAHPEDTVLGDLIGGGESLVNSVESSNARSILHRTTW